MLPPNQCLETSDFTRSQIHYRLVMGDELFVFNCPAQAGLQGQTLHRLCIHVSGVELVVIAALFLCSIQCRSRIPQDRAAVFAIERKQTNPDACGHVYLLAAKMERLFERLANSQGDLRQSFTYLS